MKLIYNTYSTCCRFVVGFPSPYPGRWPLFKGIEVFATSTFMIVPIFMALLSIDRICDFLFDCSAFKHLLQVSDANIFKYFGTIALIIPTYLFFNYHNRHEWVVDNYAGFFSSLHPFLSYWLVVIICACPLILVELITHLML